jgi:hypothetical protein
MKRPRREVWRDYLNSMLRVWVAVCLLVSLFIVTYGALWLFGNGVWQWFVAMMAYSVAVGFVMEFVKRRRI